MKVCRMCWALLDDQLNICNCTQGADPSIFFKDTSEMVNHFVTHERLMSKRARRLEELVIDMEDKTGRALVDVQNWLSKEGKLSTQVTNRVLRDLLEESRKTDKEKGSGEIRKE